MTQKTTVVLVDDHPVFLKGLRMLLEGEPDFSVLGEAHSGEQALTVIIDLQPEIVVLDISMPGISGIEVAEHLSVHYPKIKIIALSIHSEKRFVEDMLLAGAAGYILKQTVPEDLIRGIRTIMDGEAFLSPSITSVVLSGLKKNLDRENTSTPESFNVVGTKLDPTVLPDNYVERKALNSKLGKGSRLPLTLVTASAGYGKSTTVSHWLSLQPLPYSWISLDETDSDLRQLLHYFVHAVQSLFPNCLPESEVLIKSAVLPTAQALAASFLRELGELDQSFILVLDDIHLIQQKDFSGFLSEILRHPPQPLHLIILGRRDPFLPIALLRGRRMLSEIRARDLQFSLEETQEYLQLMIGEINSNELANLLHEKMEGWIAGLRLAIMSSEQAIGIEETLERLQGDSQYVQEYLYTQAVETLAPGLLTNAIQISVLDTFCAPLCEALINTIKDETKPVFIGWEFIKELRQENLFLVNLDGEDTWYRFHHVFKELLTKQLHRNYSVETMNDLHKAASVWFVDIGLIDEAIKHALLGQDFEMAENIFQQNRQKEIGQDRWHNLEKWLLLFPEETRSNSPTLLLSYAWICYNSHRLDELNALVERFELLSTTTSIDDIALVEVHLLKGILSYWKGNSYECLQHIATARTFAVETHPLSLGLMDMYETLAIQMEGNGLHVIEQLKSQVLLMGLRPAIFRSRIIESLSFVHLLDGELFQASESSERMQILCAQNNLTHAETWAHYLMGNAHFQLFNLDTAEEHFGTLESKFDIMHTKVAIDGLAGLALTQSFQRIPEKAFAITTMLEDLANQTQDYNLIGVAHSLKARLALLQGDTKLAENCLQQMGQQHSSEVSFIWLELPEITRLRIIICIGSVAQLEDAATQLATLRQQGEVAHNSYQMVDILVLETMLLLKQEKYEMAQTQFQNAITLAAKGGWIRPFMEVSHQLDGLHYNLKSVTDKEKHFCTVIEQRIKERQIYGLQRLDTALNGMTEPLTSRESEILELLALRLSNKEIGEKLFISTETVKSHMKRLFSKLDAANRRDVVKKAINLGLITPS